MPPPLALDHLACRASIDYLTVVIQEKRPAILPALGCIAKWFKKKGDSHQSLTLHDPSRADIQKIVDALGNPMLFVLELSVDFSPLSSVPDIDRDRLLRETFVAVAARFRPEDMTQWGYGLRGGLTRCGQVPLPFHQRLPGPDEELIYGGRGRFMQSKVYLKRVDQGAALPAHQHRVRMELAIKRGGLGEFGLDRLNDLVGYAFRSQFTKHFRIVSGVRLRWDRGLGEKEKIKRERRMARAWATAGVGKFAVSPELPPDTMRSDVRMIATRATNQLPLKHHVLERDQPANAKIGEAFRKLQLRMTH
jgi:hypothetical protein